MENILKYLNIFREISMHSSEKALQMIKRAYRHAFEGFNRRLTGQFGLFTLVLNLICDVLLLLGEGNIVLKVTLSEKERRSCSKSSSL